jgi:hypothetical protein
MTALHGISGTIQDSDLYKTEYENVGVHNPAKRSTYLRAYNKYPFYILSPYFHFLLNPIKLKRGPGNFNKALGCVLDPLLQLRLPIETY